MRAYIDIDSWTCLHKDIPVPVINEGVGVEYLKLGNIAPSVHVLSYKLFVRESILRIFVEELHVRVGRRRVEIVIQFFDVLAMVSLVSCNTKETFFKDIVLTVP